MNLSNKATNISAAIILLLFFITSVLSIKGDALTMDELAHLPSGYSYLVKQDMRLNPEHPPLIKDLSAAPLLFIKNINFPVNAKSWQEDVNGQWDFGRDFLYRSNNPTEEMIFWGRIPMILLTLLLGFYVFKWTRELFGNKAGILSLLLFSLCPNILAHGRLVTTDIGAALGVVIGTYYFLKALKTPSGKNILIAGIAFGIAQLLKFSLVLLIPFFGLMALIWWIAKMGNLKQTAKTLILIFIIGFILIGPFYVFHTWNYPADKQITDTQVYLKDTPDFLRNMILWSADKPILRSYAHYMTGVFMIFHRVAGGNTTYFLGEVSNLGWKTYFPVIYALKVPLAFLILTLISIFCALKSIKKPLFKNTLDWTKNHFPELAMLIFIAVYWIVSIKGDLNIGVRHLLPIFPFTIILVSSVIVKWMGENKIKKALIAVLLVWQAVSVINVYPHFITYFNELAGGPENGYKYAVDSNLDWGQDLKRLKSWTEENSVNNIYIDYFGGSDLNYIFQNNYQSWWCTRNKEELPRGSYLAVSLSFLQGGRGERVSDFHDASGCYLWLNDYQPITIIGNSIFVYYID